MVYAVNAIVAFVIWKFLNVHKIVDADRGEGEQELTGTAFRFLKDFQ